MQDYDLPIDIHAHKLQDWLISRRICKNGWQEQALDVREKINTAIQDMPEHEDIVTLLSGAYINYFNSVKIVAILRETEKDTKNIFGRYGSQRMKDWLDIMKQYEKNNMYLAEAAQILTRNLNYEIPGLKMQVAKCEQIQLDCTKKAAECTQRAVEFREEYNSLCRQFGVQGTNLKAEIVSLVRGLPDVLIKLGHDMQPLLGAVTYYEQFVRFTSDSDSRVKCIPTVRYILDHESDIACELKRDEPPPEVEEPRNITVVEEEAKPSNENEVFSGDDNSLALEPVDIDFTTIDFETGDIDWGNFEVDAQDGNGNAVIELESSEVECEMLSGILHILDNPTTRTTVLNELFELEGFLEQRLEEMKGQEDILSFRQFQNAPSWVQNQDHQKVAKMVQEVRHCISQMTTEKMQHLYLLRSSPRYVDRMVENLNQKLRLASRMDTMQQASIKRKGEAAKQAELLRPQIQIIIEKTKELQNEIAEDISKRYRNRPVNIMGGIGAIH